MRGIVCNVYIIFLVTSPIFFEVSIYNVNALTCLIESSLVDLSVDEEGRVSCNFSLMLSLKKISLVYN